MWLPGLGRYKPREGNRKGDPAPDFTLPDQDGTPVKLRDLLGDKPVVLVFYPRASSMVCTRQMCSLRDGWGALTQKATVVGVSYDKPPALKKFQQDDHLPFPLLSDPDKAVARAYGVAGLFGAARVTFVINPEGVIAAVIEHVKAGDHAAQVLDSMADGPAIRSM
jgi:peroxiredoxin Q/BCP